MLDLLQLVRSDAKHARVPVICFRGILLQPYSQRKGALDEVELACTAMGANEFFDLAPFSDDASGNAAVRRIIDELLHNREIA